MTAAPPGHQRTAERACSPTTSPNSALSQSERDSRKRFTSSANRAANSWTPLPERCSEQTHPSADQSRNAERSTSLSLGKRPHRRLARSWHENHVLVVVMGNGNSRHGQSPVDGLDAEVQDRALEFEVQRIVDDQR